MCFYGEFILIHQEKVEFSFQNTVDLTEHRKLNHYQQKSIRQLTIVGLHIVIVNVYLIYDFYFTTAFRKARVKVKHE